MTVRGDDALIVVDFQNDFCDGGALPVAGADGLVGAINALIHEFESAKRPVVLTRDWHPSDHSSFATQGGPWPVHCVAETPGAAFHPALQVPRDALVVSKGVGREGLGYSPFEVEELAPALRASGSRRLVVVGLATDYCVRATVLDARRMGWDVVVIEEAVRGVERKRGDVERARDEMLAAGAHWRTSAGVSEAGS